MNQNLRNTVIHVSCYVFIILLVALTSRNAFFWDTIQLGSLHANYYFTTGFETLLLPDNIDSGHIPAFGIYESIIWKIFGRTLIASHLAMLPFAIGIVYQFSILIKQFIPNKYYGFALIILLIDPTLLAQITLVSPDILLVFFFLMALNAVLKNKKLLLTFAIILLFLISMRGMMVALAILFFDAYCNINFNQKIKQLFITLTKRSLIYLPALILFILFNILHYTEKGWIGFHQDSPWAPSFETVDFKGFLSNIANLGWRILDFGRISLWIVITLLTLNYRKDIFKDKTAKKLFFLFLIISIVLPINMIWAKGLLGHRYLIPIYITFALFCTSILFSDYISKKLKLIFSLFLILMLSTGNLWVYPPKISQGWDATLAHLPYYNLRKETITYIDNQNIDFREVGTFFPNIGTLDNIDLNGDSRSFVEFNQNNKYAVYSNIFNISDEEYDRISSNYNLIKEFKKNNIFMRVYKKKTL